MMACRHPTLFSRSMSLSAACVMAVLASVAAAPAHAAEEHVQWVTYLPGYAFLDQFANHSAEPPLLDMGHISPDALYSALIVVALLVILALLVSRRVRRGGDEALLPADRLGSWQFAEDATSFVLNLLEDLVGEEKARQFLPLLGTLFVFILCSNLIGLIPGMEPPTHNLSLNAGMAIIVFVYYNYVGVRDSGWGYLKHFMGPFWWLAWLMIPIELVGHIVRPVTLSVRLAMNMTADHLVVGLFTDMTKLIIPVIFLLLGVLVCFIQALVFTLLTGIYIQLAQPHDEHGH